MAASLHRSREKDPAEENHKGKGDEGKCHLRNQGFLEEGHLRAALGVSHREIHGTGDGGKEQKDGFCEGIHWWENGEKTQRQKRGDEEFHRCRKEDVFAACEAVAALDHDAGRDSGQDDEGTGEVVQHRIEKGAFQRDADVLRSKGKKRAIEDGGLKCAKEERGEGRGFPGHDGVSGGAHQQGPKGNQRQR